MGRAHGAVARGAARDTLSGNVVGAVAPPGEAPTHAGMVPDVLLPVACGGAPVGRSSGAYNRAGACHQLLQWPRARFVGLSMSRVASGRLVVVVHPLQ